MKRILDRFSRNYFCWMYRLKLHAYLIQSSTLPAEITHLEI